LRHGVYTTSDRFTTVRSCTLARKPHSNTSEDCPTLKPRAQRRQLRVTASAGTHLLHVSLQRRARWTTQSVMRYSADYNVLLRQRDRNYAQGNAQRPL